MKKTMIKHSEDNVAIALTGIQKGDKVIVMSKSNEAVLELTAKTNIPYGNKIAINKINGNDHIYKDHYKIGTAIQTIEAGELVHVHNVKSNRINFPESIIAEIISQMDYSIE